MAPKRKRSTMGDVARRAGVGTATVDRVINERGNVSKEVSERVIRAARELGLKRLLPKIHQRTIRIEVILARPELPLIARLLEEFRLLRATLNASVVIHRKVLKTDDPVAIARTMSKTTCDAVVTYVREHSDVFEVVSDLRQRNVPVVNLISDLPNSERIAYVGPDHYMSGRTAAYFMTTMARPSGPIIVLASSLSILAQSERVRGLEDFLRETQVPFEIAEIVEGHEERARSGALLRTAFSEHPETVAVYNVGAANLGVAEAIRADILDRRPIFVGHELTRPSADLLREGVMSLTIDQSPELQARLAVTHIMRFFSYGMGNDDAEQFNVRPVPIVLYGPENIPADLLKHTSH
jgi:LacI family transcriptional regulator